MTRATWARMAAWSLAAPLSGLAAAFLLAGTAPPETGPALLSYTLSLAPLAATLGAIGGYRAGRIREDGTAVSRRALGVILAVVAGVGVAAGLAVVRLRQDGATGLPTIASLRYAKEILFGFGLLPATGLIGSTMTGESFKDGPMMAVVTGAVVAVATGPILILIAMMGRAGVNPVLVTGIVVAAVMIAGWRRVR